MWDNVRLTGASLESLPRCCPGLKVLHLKQIARLNGRFLSALQHLTVGCVLTCGQAALLEHGHAHACVLQCTGQGSHQL